MPLKWDNQRNPFTHNAFRILRAGPGIVPVQVVQLAQNLAREIQSGKPVELHGMPITAEDAQNASADLRNPETLVEEALLAHLPPPNKTNAPDAAPYVQQLLTFLFSNEVLSSRELSRFNPGRPGDADDLKCDIVFDA